jgi:hypothetical protein
LIVSRLRFMFRPSTSPPVETALPVVLGDCDRTELFLEKSLRDTAR